MCKFATEYGAMLDVDALDFVELSTKDGLPHWMGFDVGSTSDRSAIVDLVQMPDGCLFVEDIAVMRKASYEH